MYAKMISWRLALSVLLAVAVRAEANIDVVLRSDRPIARVGDLVEVGLYLLPNDGLPTFVGGFDALLGWDPLVLELLGVSVDGGNWWFATFPKDDGWDRINADCGTDVYCVSYTGLPFNDGDAMYSAAAAPGGIPLSGDGMRVLTFRFQALAEVPTTEIFLIPELRRSHTRVVGGDPENLTQNLTGTLRAGSLEVAACGTRGDFDADCRVGLVDHADFAACVQGPAETTLGGACPIGDMDGNSTVDLRDVQLFQRVFEGP